MVGECIILKVEGTHRRKAHTFALINKLTVNYQVERFFVVRGPVNIRSFSFALRSIRVRVFGKDIRIGSTKEACLRVTSYLSMVWVRAGFKAVGVRYRFNFLYLIFVSTRGVFCVREVS